MTVKLGRVYDYLLCMCCVCLSLRAVRMASPGLSGSESTTEPEFSDEGDSEAPIPSADTALMSAATSEPEHTHKRKRRESQWEKNRRKQLRNTGQEYVPTQNKQVEAKKCSTKPCVAVH